MNCFDKLISVITVLVHSRLQCVLSDVRTACQTHQFRCDDGDCIYIHRMCNGNNDCKDWSDETGCSDGKHPRCPKYYFQCHSDRRCVNYAFRCDGDNDCRDGSDEQNCDSACRSDQFECLKNKQCIYFLKRCDGNVDCEDGSDERSCTPFIFFCAFEHFPCANDDRCIPRAFICDGETDCDDGSDEMHCDYSTTSTPTIPVTTPTIPVTTPTIPVTTPTIPVTTTTIPVTTTVIHTAARKQSCPDNFCMHSTECVVIQGEYVCICSPYFTGEKCESRISAEKKFQDLGIVIGIPMALITLIIIGFLLIFFYFKRSSTALMRKTESQMPIASYSKE